jgi:glycosyltransferase involved in cell wall biosynthesis
MCRELARRGHEVTIYTTNLDGPGFAKVPLREPITDPSGLRLRYFPVFPHSYYCFSLSLAAALKRTVAGYDLVHIHSLYRFSTTAAAHYCRAYGVPYIMRPHGTLDPYTFHQHRFKTRLYEAVFDRRDLKLADAVHFTAQDEMELASTLGIEMKGVVAPLGVELDRPGLGSDKERFSARWPETKGKFIILFLGRLTSKKGLDLLAKSMGAICRQRDDIHLVIAGPDDEGYGAQVRQWLAGEGVSSQCTFTGMLSGRDKAEAFAAATIFVLPSYSENFGIAVIEAIACGVPVVISNRVNIWREIAAARAGAVVDCNASALTNAIRGLIDDPTRLESMRVNGPILVNKKFTWPIAVDKLMTIYRDIIARRKRDVGFRTASSNPIQAPISESTDIRAVR